MIKHILAFTWELRRKGTIRRVREFLECVRVRPVQITGEAMETRRQYLLKPQVLIYKIMLNRLCIMTRAEMQSKYWKSLFKYLLNAKVMKKHGRYEPSPSFSLYYPWSDEIEQRRYVAFRRVAAYTQVRECVHIIFTKKRRRERGRVRHIVMRLSEEIQFFIQHYVCFKLSCVVLFRFTFH